VSGNGLCEPVTKIGPCQTEKKCVRFEVLEICDKEKLICAKETPSIVQGVDPGPQVATGNWFVRPFQEGINAVDAFGTILTPSCTRECVYTQVEVCKEYLLLNKCRVCTETFEITAFHGGNAQNVTSESQVVVQKEGGWDSIMEWALYRLNPKPTSGISRTPNGFWCVPISKICTFEIFPFQQALSKNSEQKTERETPQGTATAQSSLIAQSNAPITVQQSKPVRRSVETVAYTKQRSKTAISQTPSESQILYTSTRPSRSISSRGSKRATTSVSYSSLQAKTKTASPTITRSNDVSSSVSASAYQSASVSASASASYSYSYSQSKRESASASAYVSASGSYSVSAYDSASASLRPGSVR
jgi:hypothetical protein